MLKKGSEHKKPPPNTAERLDKHVITEAQNIKQPIDSERDNTGKNIKKEPDEVHLNQQDIKEFNCIQQQAKNVHQPTNATSQKTSTIRPNSNNTKLKLQVMLMNMERQIRNI